MHYRRIQLFVVDSRQQSSSFEAMSFHVSFTGCLKQLRKGLGTATRIGANNVELLILTAFHSTSNLNSGVDTSMSYS